MGNKRISISFISLLFLTACANFNSSRQFESVSYANPKYDFRLRYPKSWILVDKANLEVGEFAVNVLKGKKILEKKLPLGVHTDMQVSYIAIWPHGLGTELPKSQSIALKDTLHSLALNFPVDQKESKLLLLKDGSIWAYFLKPKQPPESWSNFGFIFAQVGSAQPSILCYDKQTGKQLPLKECHFTGPGRVVRTANIDEKDAEAIRYILENITFHKMEEKVGKCNSIEVEKPLANMAVHSPFTVTGKAKGNWYFEGTFTVKLYDKNGKLLAKDQAKAKSKWMTDALVPFEATLKFKESNTEGGRLVFQKANPSGLKKNNISCSVPVTFSLK